MGAPRRQHMPVRYPVQKTPRCILTAGKPKPRTLAGIVLRKRLRLAVRPPESRLGCGRSSIESMPESCLWLAVGSGCFGAFLGGPDGEVVTATPWKSGGFSVESVIYQRWRAQSLPRFHLLVSGGGEPSWSIRSTNGRHGHRQRHRYCSHLCAHRHWRDHRVSVGRARDRMACQLAARAPLAGTNILRMVG